MGYENIDNSMEAEIRRLYEADERERQREIKADEKKIADGNDREFTQS
jgi:hypothetical protein